MVDINSTKYIYKEGEEMYKKGDIVMIHNSLATTGEDIEEGRAKLIDKCRQGDTGEWWDVEFLEEKGETYQRFIKY